jgi:hypothetical protein
MGGSSCRAGERGMVKSIKNICETIRWALCGFTLSLESNARRHILSRTPTDHLKSQRNYSCAMALRNVRPNGFLGSQENSQFWHKKSHF